MSSVTNPPTMLPPGPPEFPPRRVPTLDELRAMTSKPDDRVVIRDVAWDFYDRLVDSIPESEHIHVDYDGKDLEIMAIGRSHDRRKKLMGQFVERVAEECEIPYRTGGSTTWKRPEVARGLESDECYFFRVEKLAMIAAGEARKSEVLADYPNPDLSMEVDISRSKIDRPGIYAALRVAEVWRYDDERVYIDRLGEDWRYREAPDSQFLPVTAEDVRRWVVDEDTRDESAWARWVHAWARAELVPRLGR